jgi:predicted nucleic acid-binding protein
MTLVIDASVIVAALVDSGEDGTWAEARMATEPLVAPELVMVETTNILRRLELAANISPLESGLAQRDLMRLDIQLFPFYPFAERIWELRMNITSYDAWYVALAERLECPLVTLDSRLAGASGVRCQFHCPHV